jgi:hypothetical protein
VQKGKRIRVPAGRYDHVVKSLEWSRLEPHVVSVKLYARGVGIVAEHDLSGGTETFRLISVSGGSGAGFVAPTAHDYGANGMRMGLHCDTSDMS